MCSAAAASLTEPCSTSATKHSSVRRVVIHQIYAPTPANVMPLTTRQGRIHQNPGGLSHLAAFNGFGQRLPDKPMPFGRNVLRR
jgi:hypothetical protein